MCGIVGKTTLLNLLMGTAYYAHVTGDLKVNNRKVVRIILVAVNMWGINVTMMVRVGITRRIS